MSNNVLFTAEATAKGGRNGRVSSDDRILDFQLVMPTESTDKEGTNPEQLVAAGYSACFDGALNLIAKKKRKQIESSTTAKVSFEKDPEDGGFKIGVKLIINIKGVTQEEADMLTVAAHEFCPYSKAVKGNVEVQLEPVAHLE